MANDITRQGAAVKPQRDIETVTAEIKDICAQARRMMLIYAIEVGRRLVEAKEILPHGEWGDWLKNEVEFSQDTANNHMKLYHAYGSTQYTLFGADLNSETFRNLSYSAALKLLAVPADEREDFVKDNDIENKSVREIDKLIKELEASRAAEQESQNCITGLKGAVDDLQIQLEAANDEAQRATNNVDKLTNDKLALSDQIKELEDKLTKSKESEKKAKAKLKDLKANPEIPQEKIDELKADIEKQVSEANAEEVEKQLEDIRKKLAAAEEAEIKAKREAENAAGRVAELEKQVKIADPAVGEFRLLFKHVQDYIFELKTALEKIKDKPTADKLRGAMKALAAELES